MGVDSASFEGGFEQAGEHGVSVQGSHEGFEAIQHPEFTERYLIVNIKQLHLDDHSSRGSSHSARMLMSPLALQARHVRDRHEPYDLENRATNRPCGLPGRIEALECRGFGWGGDCQDRSRKVGFDSPGRKSARPRRHRSGLQLRHNDDVLRAFRWRALSSSGR